MGKLDQPSKIILRELIRNPRISDNKISRKTKIPVKSVNNKRKKMEKEGIISYFSDINYGTDGSKNFTAKAFFKITLKEGITRKQVFDMMKNEGYHPIFFKHFAQSMIAEKDGHVLILAIVESRVQEDLIEIFNAEIAPYLFHNFGRDCIKGTEIMSIYSTMRHHHNYLPYRNMENGKMADSWHDEWIFVE